MNWKTLERAGAKGCGNVVPTMVINNPYACFLVGIHLSLMLFKLTLS